MNIVRATADHLSLLIPLFDGYRQFYEQASDLTGARRFLEERLTRRDSVILLATNDSGAAVGFVQLYPSYSSVSMKRLWILNDLFVAESARGQGFAQALIKQAVEIAEETKSVGLVLETAADNLRAKKLYAKSGWIKEEHFDRYVLNLT